MESQAPQRVTGLAQVDVSNREFACWTKQFSTGWGRVRTRRGNYFMGCTGRKKNKSLRCESGSPAAVSPMRRHMLALECNKAKLVRPSDMSCQNFGGHCVLVRYMCREVYSVTVRKRYENKNKHPRLEICVKSCAVNIDELVACNNSHKVVPIRI